MTAKYNKYMVAFDNDGTMSDTLHLWEDVNAAAAKHLGLYYEPLLGLNIYLGNTRNVAWGKSMDEQKDIYWNRFCPAAYQMWESDTWLGRIELFPGIKDVLIKLNEIGFAIGVVTSSSTMRVTYPLARNEILDLVRDIISCHDMGLKDKPDIAGIQQLAQNNNVGPENIIYIGDTVGDIRMAKAFGSMSVGIGYGGYNAAEKVIAEKPDAMIHTIAEIPKIPDIITNIVEVHAGR